MIKAAVWNVRGLNNVAHQNAVSQLVREHNLHFLGLLETRVRQANVLSIRSHLLRNWNWFDDYSGPGGRIWLAWNSLEVDVEIIRVETQFIHCRINHKALHTNCLMTVSYGHCDLIPRRELWEGLSRLAGDITDEAWCVLGDFNAVTDVSEVCGRMADSTNAMSEFRDCILATALVHLPFSGCHFSWHNCSSGTRSLWKRLDRVLVNEVWLVQWPLAKYICALPSTSDHSPLILAGYDNITIAGMFRFDNFLAKQSGFLNSVWSIWRHTIHGTNMYAVVTKLKALKPVFRRQRMDKGDLSDNVRSAKVFLEKAQSLFDLHKDDLLLQLVKICQLTYCQAVKQELSMLQQRSKLNWLKDVHTLHSLTIHHPHTRPPSPSPTTADGYPSGGTASIDEGPDADPAAPLPCAFNLTEFLTLANRVVDDGDEASWMALNSLKKRWREKFGDGDLPTPTGGLKPVASRPPTPFPPARAPRRALRTLIAPARVSDGALMVPPLMADPPLPVDAPHLLL
ncbi:UNVERIFIED_CONTAM: hypothetical protein Sradi_6934300 [Sesamum radiatum]|uniref:Endonuclease/exonuclease/phosphatase domain-containing protein n=1 Tax=Sesamum radiatum TaxID=300843 RepID=A0AAW2JHU1_SESRA